MGHDFNPKYIDKLRRVAEAIAEKRGLSQDETSAFMRQYVDEYIDAQDAVILEIVRELSVGAALERGFEDEEVTDAIVRALGTDMPNDWDEFEAIPLRDPELTQEYEPLHRMEYNGYHADITYDADDDILVGTVTGIDDFVAFHGSSVAELKQMFHRSIDHYLEVCENEGRLSDDVKEHEADANVKKRR